MPNQPRPDPVYDQQHFTDLFEGYKNLVYKTAFLMCDDAAEAEEALQEVFMLVYRALPVSGPRQKGDTPRKGGYDPARGAFSTWLYRITLNYCLGRRRRLHLACEPLEEDQPAPAVNLVEERLVNRAERAEILRAIRNLTERQRSVVILRFYWELPYAEIARVLQIPLGTVKSRIDLALRTLRRSISAPEEGPALSLLANRRKTSEP